MDVLLGLLLIVALYFLPTIVAAITKKADYGAIGGINLLFGWTVIVWILCLVWVIKGLDGEVSSSPLRRKEKNMANCPVHGPLGEPGSCDRCLAEGKNIIECSIHGYQHVATDCCILCYRSGRIENRIVRRSPSYNPQNNLHKPKGVMP